MRYRIAAKVTGRIITDKATSAQQGDFVFEFIPNDKNELSQVAISMRVPKSKLKDFENSITKEPGAPLTVTIGGNEDLYNRLKDQLKTLEAHLAFLTRGALQRIELEGTIEERFIPETPEEQGLISIVGVSSTREYPIPTFEISGAKLSKFVHMLPILEPLTDIKAFLHNGELAFQNSQYIDAFRSFYFVIEDLYAGGKYRKEDILQEFSKSQELNDISIEALKPHILDGRHLVNIKDSLSKKGLQFTPEGLQTLILETRGSISHYNNRNRKAVNRPHQQRQFESVALVMMFIATYAVGRQEVKIAAKLKDKSAP